MTRRWDRLDNAMIKAGELIDGTGAPARTNVFLGIRDGIIHSVSGDTFPAAALTSGDSPLIDLSAYTVLPALIDCHVHLFMSPELDGEERRRQLKTGFAQLQPLMTRHMEKTLAAGVLAVRDGGDPGAYAVRYKEFFLGKQAPCFQMMTAGRAWYKPGRYGRIVGGEPLPDKGALRLVEAQMAGTNQVKLINSGVNSLTVFKRSTPPQFSSETLRTIVRLARKNFRPVMVHANGEVPVREAIEAGVNSIEHGFFMGRENLERMAEKGVFWVPTAGTMSALGKLGREGGEVALRNLEDQLQQMAWARETGTRIALGTDAGSPGVAHGRGVFQELGLLRQAGYSVEEAIQCATANGAELLRLPELGTLLPGRRANFIAVRGGRDDLPQSLERARLFAAAS